MLLVVSATAALARRNPAPVRGPAEIFAEISLAWQAQDEQALASLVHPDGLQVTGQRGDARITRYSPSQAYYYFKNLFRTRPTLSFTFERRQLAGGGERTRAMALWTYRTGGDSQGEDRLVLVLSSVNGLWRLSEIQAISTP